jgi:branched-subunit amino acid ABC-type transport system permease component
MQGILEAEPREFEVSMAVRMSVLIASWTVALVIQKVFQLMQESKSISVSCTNQMRFDQFEDFSIRIGILESQVTCSQINITRP